MTQNHLPRVAGIVESSEIRRVYQYLSLLGSFLIRITEVSLFGTDSLPSVQHNIIKKFIASSPKPYLLC